MWAAPRCEPPHQPTVPSHPHWLYPVTLFTPINSLPLLLPPHLFHSCVVPCHATLHHPMYLQCLLSHGQGQTAPHSQCHMRGSWGLTSQSGLGLKTLAWRVPYSPVLCRSCPSCGAGQGASLSGHRRSHLQASGPWCQTEDTWGPLPGWGDAILLLPKVLWDVDWGQAAVPPPLPPIPCLGMMPSLARARPQHGPAAQGCPMPISIPISIPIPTC